MKDAVKRDLRLRNYRSAAGTSTGGVVFRICVVLLRSRSGVLWAVKPAFYECYHPDSKGRTGAGTEKFRRKKVLLSYVFVMIKS